ncbi:MAG TPA: tRNA epoxyqueuosine(34) reductase QueG [Nitrolancea sp.]|jgi:epoxyqueuosine reductase|nr:tRNA epoxyqueuosine(34) reductase QueG [Nitrolancea sp.]
MTVLDRQRLDAIAQECGIAAIGVTTAEPFEDLGDLLTNRIQAGHQTGLDWFNEDRARFSANPGNLHPTGRSIISVGVPYRLKNVACPDDEPRGKISRYAWGDDYHRTLKHRMHAVHAALEHELGRVIEARFLVDTARIVDRAVAARSGLGWYGKNTMILVPGHGSWVLLGDMIVDIEIEPDTPLRPKCGRCTMCIDHCPTGALQPGYIVETPRCISYLTIELRGAIPVELRPLLGRWVFGCDDCQEICPYTGAAKRDDDSAFAPRAIENAFPRLRWLLTMTDAEFRETYRGTAVLRAKRSGIARNAAVALGNSGNDDDLELLELVVSSHDLPLVRGHAAWAMRRINPLAAEPFLERQLDIETDQSVRTELIPVLEDIG